MLLAQRELAPADQLRDFMIPVRPGLVGRRVDGGHLRRLGRWRRERGNQERGQERRQHRHSATLSRGTSPGQGSHLTDSRLCTYSSPLTVRNGRGGATMQTV